MFEADDFDIFFDDFGITVTIDGKEITAVFDAPYQVARFGDQDVSSYAPQLVVMSSDLTTLEISLQFGTPATVLGTDYIVANTQPDGGGFTLIELKED